MEVEDLLPWSQESAAGLISEPMNASSYSYNQFL
jgi:hypothetical protein